MYRNPTGKPCCLNSKGTSHLLKCWFLKTSARQICASRLKTFSFPNKFQTSANVRLNFYSGNAAFAGVCVLFLPHGHVHFIKLIMIKLILFLAGGSRYLSSRTCECTSLRGSLNFFFFFSRYTDAEIVWNVMLMSNAFRYRTMFARC